MVKQEIKKQEVSEVQKMFSNILQTLEEGKPLYLACGLTEDDMESIHKYACSLYREKEYLKALPFFQCMSTYSHLDSRGWMGAGLCFEKLKNYKVAVVNYFFANIFDPENTLILFHQVNCYIMLKNYTQAINVLESIIAIAKKNPSYDAVKKAEETKEELMKLMSH